MASEIQANMGKLQAEKEGQAGGQMSVVWTPESTLHPRVPLSELLAAPGLLLPFYWGLLTTEPCCPPSPWQRKQITY